MPQIDYLTFHCWAQNWNWYDPHKPDMEKTQKKVIEYLDANVKIARELGKPIVLEEFGLSRDKGDYDPFSDVSIKNEYYQFVFSYVVDSIENGDNLVGTNFWAWAGEGKPVSPGGWWKAGDPFIGDPPHEPQGWYSVYDTDVTTLDIVEEYQQQASGKVIEVAI